MLFTALFWKGLVEGQRGVDLLHPKGSREIIMRMACRISAVVMLAWCVELSAQSPAPGGDSRSGATNAASVLSVPPGENLVLELKSPLNSKTARKGDVADFSTTSEVLVGAQVAIPRGTTVHATVTQAKKAGSLTKPHLQLQFNEIVLADGTHKPLSADLMRSGFLQAKGERSKAQTARTIAISAAPPAIIGGILGGAQGAAQGAAIGAAVGAVMVLMQHGPDLDFPAGMQFEIELTKPLDVPLLPQLQLAASPPPLLTQAGPVPTEDPKSVVPPPSQSGPVPGGNADANSGSKPAETATATADRTVPPVKGASVSPALPATPNTGGYMLKVDVNLVVVEATVRDERGQVVDNLKRDNFHIYEDGTEQQIVQF